MSCQNCGNPTPCDCDDCACPVKDLLAKCVTYNGESLDNTGIHTPDTLDVIIYKLDKAIKDYVDSHSASVAIKNIGSGKEIYAGDDNTGKKQLRTLLEGDGITLEIVNDSIKITSTAVGALTSVGLSLPDIFSVTNSPLTENGEIDADLTEQTKNEVFASPATADGTPSFRKLVEADIPSIHKSKISDLTIGNGNFTVEGGGIATGSETFSANSSSDKTATIQVPGTDITLELSGSILIVKSSTGDDGSIDLSGLGGSTATPNLQQVTTEGASTDKDVTISDGTDSVQLKANGDIEISGHITALGGGGVGSDIRLKDVQDKPIPRILSKLTPILFKWKRGKDKKDKVGYKAQDVQKVLPGAVGETSDGYLTVDYTQVHTAQIDELYKIVKFQQEKIEKLESKLKV